MFEEASIIVRQSFRVLYYALAALSLYSRIVFAVSYNGTSLSQKEGFLKVCLVTLWPSELH